MNKQIVVNVDSNALNLDSDSRLLGKAGYEVVSALNALEVAERLKSVMPDLFILDVTFPRKLGFNIAKMLKSNEAFANIPMIYASSRYDENSCTEAFENGGCDFIARPFKEKELLARIKYHIQNKQRFEDAKAEAEKYKVINIANKNLMAITAHDLKNPLQSIFNYLEVVEKHYGEINKSQFENLIKSTKNAASHAFNIIKDVLDTHNIESGKLKLDFSFVSINNTLEKIVHLNRIKAEHKQVALKLLVTAEEMVVKVDNSKLERVFDNLISNAIKFSPENRQISIRSFPVAESVGGKKMARIEINDQGPGIPTSFKEYTPMSSFSASALIANETSHGLGLNIVQNLVTVMNGNVWVENSPGKGANFIVEFPLTDK